MIFLHSTRVSSKYLNWFKTLTTYHYSKIIVSCFQPQEYTVWKASKHGVISGPYFPVFELNTGKYGPEKTPYLNTFNAVRGIAMTRDLCENRERTAYNHYPVGTVNKLNVYKTFRRLPGRLLNVLCTFSLCPVSTG